MVAPRTKLGQPRQALSHSATRSCHLGNSQDPGTVGSRVELSETPRTTAMILARHVGVARAPHDVPPQPNQKKSTPRERPADFGFLDFATNVSGTSRIS